MLDGTRWIEPPTTIKERVGGDIDDTHYRGYREIKRVSAAAKQHRKTNTVSAKRLGPHWRLVEKTFSTSR
jgi:hypothetical protein